MKNTYLFLYASHSDEDTTKQLTTKLEEAGYKVWLGQAGDDEQQRRQTEFAIERSDAYLLALTPETVNAAGVSRELALAQKADKPIYLIQLRPVNLPESWQSELAEWSLVDASGDFDAGLAELLALLADDPDAAVGEQTPTGDFFGGEKLGRVPALPGERIIWSEAGLYWFNKWRNLVRVLAVLTGQRLIFLWDSRDMWKWKPREADTLEETFPLILSLDRITAVGEVHRPKSFLIFATGKPHVDIMVDGRQLHRFSLETKEFETLIDTLRDAATG